MKTFNEFMSEGWSAKYKKSIDCNNPKGFSQKAHCAGRKVVILLCVTGLARVALLMAPLVGFSWAVNTQENPVQDNQDKRPNPSAVLQK